MGDASELSGQADRENKSRALVHVRIGEVREVEHTLGVLPAGPCMSEPTDSKHLVAALRREHRHAGQVEVIARVLPVSLGWDHFVAQSLAFSRQVHPALRREATPGDRLAVGANIPESRHGRPGLAAVKVRAVNGVLKAYVGHHALMPIGRGHHRAAH